MGLINMTKPLSGFIALLVAIVSMLALPAQAQDDGYRLRPGDVLQVEVLEDPSLNRSVLVLPNGSITLPQAGTLRAGGRTPDELRGAVTAALAPNFAAPPTVYVSVASVATAPLATGGGAVSAAPQTMDVYVMGEVGAPGRKKVAPDTNLLQFMAQAGALTKFAADQRIELHRKAKDGSAQIYMFNLRQVAGGKGRISGMTQMAPGDVVVVPQRKLFE
jgi:polysaccharide export outer membrane protein